MTAGDAGRLIVCAILVIGLGAILASLIGRRFYRMDQERLAKMTPKTRKALGL